MVPSFADRLRRPRGIESIHDLLRAKDPGGGAPNFRT